MANGDPVVIKGGGSIEITLHKDTFPQDPAVPAKHYCLDRKLTRVVITDDTTGKAMIYDLPNHGKTTISIHHSR